MAATRHFLRPRWLVLRTRAIATRRSRSVVLALVTVLAASTVHANGRPPATNGIYFKPGDVHSLYARTTFGFLISHDDGCTFYWYCENDVGYAGTFDPKYAIATDGTIYATTFNGLRISRDDGCSFQTSSSLPASTWVDALDIGPSGEVWAGTASTAAANDVYASVDAGMTFQARGLSSLQVWFKSIKVAPSNAMRVYATGYQVSPSPVAHLYHTDDDGAHWAESPLTGVSYGSTPLLLVLAVDPQNPDVAYIVSQGANASGQGDILYRTSDAGQTLTPVLSSTSPIGDVVIHAGTVFANTLVQQGPNYVGGPMFKSTDGTTFADSAVTTPHVACLGIRPDNTFVACGTNWDPDFMAFATSSDGATWQKVWRFVNLWGPGPQCAAGTPERDTCGDQQWPLLAQQFGVTGPTCGANIYPDGPPEGGPAKKKGCCDAGGGAAGSLAWAALVAAWLARKRR